MGMYGLVWECIVNCGNQTVRTRRLRWVVWICLILYDSVCAVMIFMGGRGVPTAEGEARARAAVVISCYRCEEMFQPRGKKTNFETKKGKAYGVKKVGFQNRRQCGWWRWTSGRSHKTSCTTAEAISKDLGCSILLQSKLGTAPIGYAAECMPKFWENFRKAGATPSKLNVESWARRLNCGETWESWLQ